MRLSTQASDFATRFAALAAMRQEESDDAARIAAEIIADIRARGDAALLDYTHRFDRVKAASLAELRVSDAELNAAEAECDDATRAALDLAATRIADYHARQKPEDSRYQDEVGLELGAQWRAVDAAGLYVPGGTAAYPSSVLMNAIPAKTAGVARLIMCVPTPDNVVSPFVLAAAKRAEIDEIYRIGGAQAIAAMAYGTPSLAPVDVIVGPGNAYVAAAKQQVFGQVGIDAIAGPSEVLIIADAENDPDWIAADLLAQAEHDKQAQSILLCDDADFADAVEAAIARQLESLPRAEIARTSWQDFGAIILVEDLAREAAALVNRLAPEHVQIALDAPEAIAAEIRHAGAIFLGRHAPEAIGDYIAGANHVLPTLRAARYASGLSVLTFMKRSSLISCTPDALAALGPAAMQLAEIEGLAAHGQSIAVRLNKRR